MTKDCKYDGFSIRFLESSEEFKPGGYDLLIFQEGDFDRGSFWEKCKNKVIFRANEKLLFLSDCEKFIIVQQGQDLNLVWTSFKGKPELWNLRGGEKTMFDQLFMTFSKQFQKVLYIGNSVHSAWAGWRNRINVDVLSTVNMVDEFLKLTQEQTLAF